MLSVAKCALLVMIAVGCAFGAVKFFRAYLAGLEEPVEIKKSDKIIFIVLAVCYALAAGGVFFLYVKKGFRYYHCIEYLVLWCTMLLISMTDIKAKKVPNKLVLFMLAVRAVFIVAEIIDKPKNWKLILASSAIGFLVGGLIIFVCMLISRGGIGAGDMKLFAALGLYFGFRGIIPIMLYSIFLSALFSIVLLASRKAKLKSTVAMAPFIFAGLNLYIIFI